MNNKKELCYKGIGIHTGEYVEVFLANNNESDIKFILPNKEEIRADINYAFPRFGATILKKDSISLYTVEHIMAVLFAKGLPSVSIYLSGYELPIGDGSSIQWCKLLEELEKRDNLKKKDKLLIVNRKARFYKDNSWIEVEPFEGVYIKVIVEFDKYPFLNSIVCWDGSWESFCSEIAPARTFSVLKEAKRLIRNGMAKGGNLNNCLLFDTKGNVINKTRLRYFDEPARHKLLDFLGDIGLLGLRLKGKFTVYRPSHKTNIELLKQFLKSKSFIIKEIEQ